MTVRLVLPDSPVIAFIVAHLHFAARRREAQAKAAQTGRLDLHYCSPIELRVWGKAAALGRGLN